MALPDLIAGLVWVAVALLVIRRRGSTTAAAAAVALTWFVAELLPQAVFWHRFALVALLVCAPRWLPRTWTARGILALALLASLAVLPWSAPLGAVVLSAAFVVAAALEQPRRGALHWAAVGLTAIAFAVPVLLNPGPAWAEAIGWAYAGSISIVGLLVVADMATHAAGDDRLDLLVELESTAAPASPRDRAAAERLLAKHERLLSELDAGVAELRASRRRLAEARLTASRELREDLEARVLGPLAMVSTDAARAAHVDARADALAAARQHVRAARADIEAISAGLGPRSLAKGLAAALEELATSSPVAVTFTLPEREAPVGDDVAARTAYLVGAEALANAAKHAHARDVRMRLQTAGDELVLTVADDGAGGADPVHGTGLAGMRDRVEAVGGSLMVRSDSSGTVVTARIPAGAGRRSRPGAELSEAAMR